MATTRDYYSTIDSSHTPQRERECDREPSSLAVYLLNHHNRNAIFPSAPPALQQDNKLHGGLSLYSTGTRVVIGLDRQAVKLDSRS